MMRKLLSGFAAALLFSTALIAPAHAEPVTLAIFGSAWIAANGVLAATITAALNIGASIALSSLAYALSSSGKRQDGAQAAPISIQIPERGGLLEQRQIYGEVTTAGGVFC